MRWVRRLAPLAGVLRAPGGLVVPRRCLLCGRSPLGRSERLLCRGCARGLPHPPPAICPRCSGPVLPGRAPARSCPACRTRPPFLREIRAPYPYEGILRALVAAYKFGPEPALDAVLGPLLVRALEVHPFGTALDLCVPVPLHRRRLRRRGFNQAERLACHVARALALPVDRASLVRSRRTAPQVGQGAAARRRNVRGAFRCRRPGAVRGRSVLLVDDVLTTGSTAAEAARTLRRSGARNVVLAAVARAGPASGS